MTSPTRPARCTTDRPGNHPVPRARQAAAALAVAPVLGLALSACGALSRPVLLRSELAHATAVEDMSAALGAEPMLPSLWAWSASRQSTPEAAMAVLERGRSFHPADPQLLVLQLSLLAQMGRRAEQIESARAALAAGHPSELEVELRWWILDAHLGLGDLAAAEAECVRLGGVRGAPQDRTASAWARLAAAQEFLGDAAAADASVERSLDLGAAGLVALRETGLAEPEKRAATSGLIARAAARHPAHPDLQLQLVFERMQANDVDGAEAALAALPSPLPRRLRSDVELVRARVDVLADRTDRALETLRRRLDDRPDDTLALGVLLECWRLRGRPSLGELRLRMQWAQGRVESPAAARQIAVLAAELDRQTAP